MNQKTGILLVNLGTPDSPKPKDVHKYLIEFLTDGRVIDVPWFKRQCLVRGIIVPRRYKESAKSYADIWTEEGSPLMVYGLRVEKLLQESLGDDFQVALAMRYQNPSIESALETLKTCTKLIILPLFPQYASATTGSIHQKVMQVVSLWRNVPELKFINSFATNPKMIEAFCQIGRQFPIEEYDQVVFSFHGLPEKHIKRADPHGYCLKEKDCCKKMCSKNSTCYSAQCFATAQALVEKLGLEEGQYTVAFQSRLGKDPWLKPYMSETLHQLQKEGKKRVLVFCPAFVCDCLETIHEIGIEYRNEFLENGGERYDLVPGLNDHPLWIEALEAIINENVGLHKINIKLI
jgi:ferrochelatase